jgi:hypothetical protein
VQLELAAPVVLVAEGVEAEDVLALLEQPTSAFAHPWPGSSTDCDSQAPGLSSGFDKETAASIVASAVTATPVIATTVTLDDDPLIGFIGHLPLCYRFGSIGFVHSNNDAFVCCSETSCLEFERIS